MVQSALVFALVAVVTTSVRCSSLSSTLTLLEQHNIAKSLLEPPKDLVSAYYAVTALNAIDKEVADKEGMCSFAAGQLKKDSALSMMQYSTIAKILGCKADVVAASLITENMEAVPLANVIIAMSNLGEAVDEALVKKFVAVAKDADAPTAAAASFHAASALPKETEALKAIVSMVEDIVAQADEVRIIINQG